MVLASNHHVSTAMPHWTVNKEAVILEIDIQGKWWCPIGFRMLEMEAASWGAIMATTSLLDRSNTEISLSEQL